MNARELMADLPFSPGHEADARLYARLFCRYLADHLYSLELASGAGLRDVSDVKQLLDECVKTISPSTEVPSSAVIGACPKVTESEQPRGWKAEPICPECQHVHEGRSECSKYLGEEKFCRCVSKVTA